MNAASTADGVRDLTRHPQPDAVADSEPLVLVLPGADTPLHCERVVRRVPGKRVVVAGRWGDTPVYVKLYVHPRSARRHWAREADGLQCLRTAGVTTPTLLYAGPGPDADIYVLVTEAVLSAVTAHEAWHASDDREHRHAVIRRLAGALAVQHERGVFQRDIYLKNFLLTDDAVWVIDGDTVEQQGGPIAVHEGLRNLASLMTFVRPPDPAILEDACKTYVAARSDDDEGASAETAGRFRTAVAKGQRRKRYRYLDKSLRDCTAFATGRRMMRRWVLDRSDDSPGMRALLADPEAEAPVSDAVVLKRGNTCTVWRADCGTRRYVIKRYNIKSLGHALRRLGRHPRARAAWLNAQRFHWFRIPACRPVALIEPRMWPWVGRAYLITEFINGVHARDYFRRVAGTDEARATAAERVARAFLALRETWIEHGDAKATNLWLTADAALWIDLDAAAEHRSRRKAVRGHERDVARFFREWRDVPAVESVLMDAFQRVYEAAGIEPPVGQRDPARTGDSQQEQRDSRGP